MKNKFFKLLLLFFFINCNHLYADSFSFDVKNIIIEDNGNLIYANSGKALSSSDDFEIVAEKFKYNKKKDFLEASNGDAFIKNQNLTLLHKFDWYIHKSLTRYVMVLEKN